MRGLLSVTQARPVRRAFALDQAWQLHPQVALRDESFGALAYHYGNRRLVFLKSRLLVELVSSLDEYDTAADGHRARSSPRASGAPTGGPWPAWPTRR